MTFIKENFIQIIGLILVIMVYDHYGKINSKWDVAFISVFYVLGVHIGGLLRKLVSDNNKEK